MPNERDQDVFFINVDSENRSSQMSLTGQKKLNPITQTGWTLHSHKSQKQPSKLLFEFSSCLLTPSIQKPQPQFHNHKASIIFTEQWKRTTTNNKASHPQPPSSPPHLASNSSQDPGSQTLVQLHPAPSSSCSTATPGPFALPRQTQVGDCGGAFEGHRFAESEALWCESSLHSVAWE